MRTRGLKREAERGPAASEGAGINISRGGGENPRCTVEWRSLATFGRSAERLRRGRLTARKQRPKPGLEGGRLDLRGPSLGPVPLLVIALPASGHFSMDGGGCKQIGRGCGVGRPRHTLASSGIRHWRSQWHTAETRRRGDKETGRVEEGAVPSLRETRLREERRHMRSISFRVWATVSLSRIIRYKGQLAIIIQSPKS